MGTFKVSGGGVGGVRMSGGGGGLRVGSPDPGPPVVPTVPDAPPLSGFSPFAGFISLLVDIPNDNGSPLTQLRLYDAASDTLLATFPFSGVNWLYSSWGNPSGVTRYFYATAVNANGESPHSATLEVAVV